jgi:CheY-like chemotaxis protein
MLNMERTYILGSNQRLRKEFGENFIELPDLINEVEIHSWVIGLFRSNDIEKVVIEIGVNPLIALQVGYHIRLSIEDLERKALLPILFVSTLSLNAVMLQSEIYSQILSTKGIVFSELDLQSIKTEIENMNGLNESEYLTKFLKTINIQPDETIGRHSLANIWGAYAMDKAANANALPADSEFKKKLYFKYVSAFNNIDKLKPSPLKILGNISVGNINKVNLEGKRILLIDDEAEKGWEAVLRKVLKTTNPEDFVVINERVKDFESFSEANKNIINSEKFDLYLVDLRLNGLEEDENLKTKEFSGMKVLQKIKSLNEGNQVIIFTASNKVWNLKSLLDAGADGYYMKESPEYNFSRVISEQNYKDFKENVKACFGRGYLSEVYKHWINAKDIETTTDHNFIAESNIALDIAWEQIKNEFLDFGFLTLYQSLESYANTMFHYDNISDTFKVNDTTVTENINLNDGEKEWLLTYNEDSRNGHYFSSGKLIQKSHIKPTALFKISCLLHIKYKKDDAFLKDFGKLNKLRNDIAHGGSKGFTTKDDLVKVLDIIKEIRNS